jgi:hypothetical protein
MDILRPTRKENVVGNLRINGDPGSTVPASYVLNPADRAPTTVKETTEKGSGNMFLTGQQQGGYHSNQHQAVLNQRDTTSCQNMGAVGGPVTATAGVSLLGTQNQSTNLNKSLALKTRHHQGGTDMFNPSFNIHVDKRDSDRQVRQAGLPGQTQAPPSVSSFPSTYVPPETQSLQAQRMDSSILDAFRKNPYTQSLSSY